MRILAVSDAHGAVGPVELAIEKSGADIVAYLGDGVSSLADLPQFYPEKTFYFVKGNCDFSCDAPYTKVITVASKRILLTHGHYYHVKAGRYELKTAARSQGADVVLFGHTHVPLTEYEDGLYIMNPGSIAQPRAGRATYGVVDIVSAGIVTNIVPLHGF